MARRIWKLEAKAREQDRYAAECHAKGEPKYNLHSTLAEHLRQRIRAIRLANKEQKN